MDIAVWAFVAFVLLVVVRRNISFFEISFFNLCVAYGTFEFIHSSLLYSILILYSILTHLG
jgi:hypothetical protein